MPNSFKIILIGLLMGFVGLFWAGSDIHMKVSGKKTKAMVTDISKDGRQAFYTFTDDKGTDATGSFGVSSGWQPSPDGTVEVVYLPGKPETVRLAGGFGYTGVLVLFAGIAITVMGFVVFNQESIVDAHRQTQQDIDDHNDPVKRLVPWKYRMLFGFLSSVVNDKKKR